MELASLVPSGASTMPGLFPRIDWAREMNILELLDHDHAAALVLLRQLAERGTEASSALTRVERVIGSDLRIEHAVLAEALAPHASARDPLRQSEREQRQVLLLLWRLRAVVDRPWSQAWRQALTDLQHAFERHLQHERTAVRVETTRVLDESTREELFYEAERRKGVRSPTDSVICPVDRSGSV